MVLLKTPAPQTLGVVRGLRLWPPIASAAKSDERWQKFITKIHADLAFQGCISFLRCFRTPDPPTRKIPVYADGHPVLSLHGLRLCKFVSRSDLVLDADHALNFLSNLVLQACFIAFQTKVVYVCFCFVRLKHAVAQIEMQSRYFQLQMACIFYKAQTGHINLLKFMNILTLSFLFLELIKAKRLIRIATPNRMHYRWKQVGLVGITTDNVIRILAIWDR